jgi:hypothetical protein
MAESQYSFSLTTFSPSGKLAQIEYALNAVAAGVTSLGISATDGVVIATEKKLPSVLVDEATVQKINLVSSNIAVVYSGMGPDFRVLVRRARKTAQVCSGGVTMIGREWGALRSKPLHAHGGAIWRHGLMHACCVDPEGGL